MKLAKRLNSYVNDASILCVEARYARLNWNAHVVPAAESAHSEFLTHLRSYRLQELYFSVLSREYAAGAVNPPEKEWWSDSITFSFGARPVPVEPVVKVPGQLASLYESQASLVVGQTVSGAITAAIYPPSSEVSKPSKPYYVVGVEIDPAAISKEWILDLLKLTFEVDMFCSARIFPNKRGGRVMARLRAKDAVLAEGGSALWVWLRYIWSATTGVMRMYGVGKPTL